MGLGLRLENTQAVPVLSLFQIDLGHGYRAPVLALREHLAVVSEHRADHPVRLHVAIRAAHDIHMVLARTRLGKQWIAAPDRPCDDLSAIERELARDLGEESVVA